MIKIEKTSVMNMDNAIRGMRNPMNSWHKSDSGVELMNEEDVEFGYTPNYQFVIGENDLELMKRLTKAGTDHRKFLRQIFVSVDITAPLYWWKEYDTYKVGTVSNSCSTMHKIHTKEFELDDFSHEHLLNDWDINAELYRGCYDTLYTSKAVFDMLVEVLDHYRNLFLKTKDKKYWWQMIQLLPTSYNQKRTVMLNYEVLINQYFARRNHKLDEWHTYCEWIESLPYMKELLDAVVE